MGRHEPKPENFEMPQILQLIKAKRAKLGISQEYAYDIRYWNPKIREYLKTHPEEMFLK